MAMTRNEKTRSCELIMSAPPCVASRASLACHAIPFLRGSKKAKALPPLEQTLVAAQEGDELELDEMWSLVKKRKNKRWLWLALCRRTRQIVAYALGSRGIKTCRLLWQPIPDSYKSSLCYSDFWKAYQAVLPPKQHLASQRKGKTNHIERFNNTLRQRLARLVRRTLSFSKINPMHEATIKLFIHRYNAQCSPH
jgi:insertion element IS1 protein InsB